MEEELHFKGIIFDMDGVITQTAKLHFAAWKKMFDEYLDKRSKLDNNEYREFLHEEDYIPYVDGKPRYEGVKSFLESREIEIPYGSPDDSDYADTICGVGNKKNQYFLEFIENDRVEIYESTVQLIKNLKSREIKLGVASSSKNCMKILKKLGLYDMFDAVIGGRISRKLDLNGKPEPDIFLTACEQMGLTPDVCAMVEDAVSGVQAGKNGRFALVIGVCRGENCDQLYESGADIVLMDMSEISIEDIDEWFRHGLIKDEWQLVYNYFDFEKEKTREALTTIGNGYFGTRGCCVFEEDSEHHYPGTYIAGLYNKMPTEIHGKVIYNNDFVNIPNWLLMKIKIGDSEFIKLSDIEILEYNHILDIKKAMMFRNITIKDKMDRITIIKTRRFASMDNPHIGAVMLTIIPVNYTEKIILKSSIDGSVVNNGVVRYRNLESKHIDVLEVKEENNAACLISQTKTSKIQIHLNTKTKIETDTNYKKDTIIENDKISQVFEFDSNVNQPIKISKIVNIYTSKDIDIPDYKKEYYKSIYADQLYKRLLKQHNKKWSGILGKMDIKIKGDRFSQKAVRFHLYHLMAVASGNNIKIDAGIPARGLHGEAYRGHIFWDTLFILPFYNLHFPEVSKSALMYRYNRLDKARDNASESGYTGAMYPWQSADDGTEETQEIHYNPVSKKWDPDLSRYQRHISITILYNILEYFYFTADTDFLNDYGAEMIVEIIRFWVSKAEFDEKDGRYHIDGVMGPDEFHEKLPGRETAGFRDNAYTNFMVSWIIHKSIKIIKKLSFKVIGSLANKVDFDIKELNNWKKISLKMNIILNKEYIISQFEGYEDLLELDFDKYRDKYGDIHRIDRILKAEGDSPDKYRVAKQPDVLMLFYLLSPDQVKNFLELLEYNISIDAVDFLQRNYQYYLKRTTNGSTLSNVIHSTILKYLPDFYEFKWDAFKFSLKSDIDDIQDGTTQEGIHTGVMAGTISIIINNFAGINFFKDVILINPWLPEHWESIYFKILYKNNWYSFFIDHNFIIVNCNKIHNEAAVMVNNKKYKIKENKEIKIRYN